ncbi:MAG: L-histidine N(alpha)-methyltransferase [Chlorobi bacterium]|nr:L-histidine N(alpha)-methyltransferase [Chlorobiota bacterium]
MSWPVIVSDLATDTLRGLSSAPKYLLAKHLYDDKGSELFRQIMQMPEYYLTNCELEIFRNLKEKIVDALESDRQGFDLIEFGSGDGSKTSILLDHLHKRKVNFRYIPVDISERAMEEMVRKLKRKMPALDIKPLTGDYFLIMQHHGRNTGRRKVIFFLGANIGNFSPDELSLFFKQLRGFTQKGDMVLIGFDLKKSPEIILAAYHDPHGITTTFTMNHLIRLNRELKANFNPDQFEHHTEYNPLSGDVKSFLISVKDQDVNIALLEQRFRFYRWEPVFMELSRKYDLSEIYALAGYYDFKIIKNFTDRRLYFTDTLWIRE